MIRSENAILIEMIHTRYVQGFWNGDEISKTPIDIQLITKSTEPTIFEIPNTLIVARATA